MLGFSNSTATSHSFFGDVPDTYGMDEVRCSGLEMDIRHCEHVTVNDCGQGEGAGVMCF